MIAEVKLIVLIKWLFGWLIACVFFRAVCHAFKAWDEVVERTGPWCRRVWLWWAARRERAAREVRWAVWPVRKLGQRGRKFL